VIGLRVQLVAGIALIAFAVGASGTYYVMKNAQNAKELAIYKEGQRRQTAAQGVVNEYVAEIATLHERKPRVVRYCPDVPAAASRPDAPSPTTFAERDLGPLLRETYEELVRCNKAREAMK
jgi:hypothetical protein